tara:strand:+ start:66 stop:242 length:177 start_codon:yes stop_codon:yes gene_type:complete
MIDEDNRIFVSVNSEYMLITIGGKPYKKYLDDRFLIFLNQQVGTALQERQSVRNKDNN